MSSIGNGGEDTPAICAPLRSRQSYYMLNDFNHHHHHAVLAGNSWRYSSTHRVAVVKRDTWEYIWGRCRLAQKQLAATSHDASAMRTLVLAPVCDLFSQVCAWGAGLVGEVATEVEFQWVRMFWLQVCPVCVSCFHSRLTRPHILLLLLLLLLQGSRHADSHSGYWLPRIKQLTEAWKQFEVNAAECMQHLKRGAKAANAVTAPPLRCYDMMVYLLDDRQEKRREFSRREGHITYRKLPADCRPVQPVAPWFRTPTEPLPEDLTVPIAAVKKWKARRSAL